MSDLVISSKLHPPRAASHLVVRRRLLARLHECPTRSLTLVVAPAGFGKTTIVTQWLAERTEAAPVQPTVPTTHPARVAWLSLDEGDSALDRFWRYLLAAIERAYPASCPETAQILNGDRLPAPQRLADYLSNDLADLPGHLVIVLDDYHCITSPEVHEAIMRLLTFLPDQVHLVLTSRSDPPLSVGRLRAQGQVVDLRATDLRFTPDETYELLEGTAASSPQLDTTVALLHARTEGWAVGLQLARILLRDTPDAEGLLQGLRGTHRLIADYLLDEVLSRQPIALQGLLLLLAIPERFCQELIDNLLEDALVDAEPVAIAELDRRGLFLIALDDEERWYRYHHLVRDLLAMHLARTLAAPTVAALHRRCSRWFAQRGLLVEAVHHALAAGDQTLAARIVEGSLNNVLEQDNPHTSLAALVAMLPRSLVDTRPRLLVARAFDCFFRWDFAGLPASTRHAMERLAEPDNAADVGADLDGDLALLRAIGNYWAGDFVTASAQAEAACRTIPPARATIHALAVVYYAAAVFHRGDYARAMAMLREELGRVGEAASPATGMLLLGLCVTDLLSGNLEPLAHYAQRLQADFHGHNTFYACWSHYLLGRYYYERNELNAAQSCFVEASSFPFGAQERVHFDSLMGLASIALARGDVAQADEFVRRGHVFARERASPSLRERAVSLQASIALARADRAAAVRYIHWLNPTVFSGHAFWLEQPHLTRAAVLIEQASPASLAEATHNLERYLAQAEGAHNLYLQVRAGALLALAYDAQGIATAALVQLEQTLARAAAGGFLRSMADSGAPLAALLRRLPVQGPGRAFADCVLAACSADAVAEAPGLSTPRVLAPVGPIGAARDLLTEREQEILRLLAERLTDQEIAERLIISITTVRTHTRRIYGKLDVENRRQAISRAREYGLLEPLAAPRI